MAEMRGGNLIQVSVRFTKVEHQPFKTRQKQPAARPTTSLGFQPTSRLGGAFHGEAEA
jgi:hypothetical protein